MPLDLSAYKSIQTNLFVKLVVPNYATLTFSDYHKSVTLNSVTYTGLGQLLTISNTSNNLRANPEELTIGISGIPAGNVSAILNNKIKGSQIEIARGFFNSVSGELLNIAGNPAGKFKGIVNNYTIEDDLTEGDDTGKISIILSATNVVDILNNKIAGRRTNPIDHKLFYPSDLSMDRVPALAKSNFNFGAPE